MNLRTPVKVVKALEVSIEGAYGFGLGLTESMGFGGYLSKNILFRGRNPILKGL